ncbi:hypothetical protein BO71DRAFT_104886 [Aspergillus ellipticus CBS 707.79]|uniref:Uncharacterized protein n=1 Tax=Aspergillus ellipticus CBS 707.79 TaxID=1448320 RepID=A0A319CYF5_9EURO|nr:hypothetical protein BO71DRAFT_104886 [Aspergillus ellipticus CBS 707.79]
MGFLRALLPSIGSFFAFVLGMLCIFAGNQRQVLPQADLVTLYTHGAGGDGAPDFFSVYTMSYCTGFQNTSDSKNTTTTEDRLVDCSNWGVQFVFNPAKAILKAVGDPSGTLSPDTWPSCITDDFEALQLTNSTMVVLLMLGTAAAAVAIGIRIWSIAFARALGRRGSPTYPGHSGAHFEFDNPPTPPEIVAFFVSVLGLGIGSVIASVIATEFVKLINTSGNAHGVSATGGSTFLGLAWTATVLQVLGMTDIMVSAIKSRNEPCWCDLDERASLTESPEQKPLVGSD